MPQILPCVPSEPSYEFTTILNNTSVRFAFRWNARDAAWYFDIYDANDKPIIHSVKVVLGVPLGRRSTHPLLTRGVLVAMERARTRREPGLDDLGSLKTDSRVVLVYYTAQEMSEALFRQARG